MKEEKQGGVSLNHDASFVEARAALPLDGGVKCRQPERAEDGRNRSVLEDEDPGETGEKEKEKGKKKMNGKGMKAIPILVMLALMIGAYAPVAFAATDFTLDWSGSGNVAGAFTATGTTASFSTGGSAILGSWDVVIGGQAYGVDYTTSDFGASFTGGGYISYLEESLDRATGSGVWSDATGSAYQNVLTNYAALYVFADDNQFLATGNYHAGHAIDNGANFAQWSATGSGTMTIFERIDSASYYGTTDWTFGGPGCGSYGTSVATFTGSGIFNLNAGSDNYLAGVIGTPYATPQPGWKMPSGGEYHATWYFDGGLIIPDFSLAGN